MECRINQSTGADHDLEEFASGDIVGGTDIKTGAEADNRINTRPRNWCQSAGYRQRKALGLARDLKRTKGVVSAVRKARYNA